MLSWPPSPDAWRACLKDGDIIVVLMPIEGAIAQAREVARRRCAELLDAFPGCFASRSATDGLAAVALAATARVGVDVERIDPRFTPDEELLDMALDPAERATLGRQQRQHFQRLWTCKESALKAAGAGLAAVALAATARVGVDVERIDPRFTPDEELLDMALDPTERATVARHDLHDFQRLWTRKESALKAAGAGLALRPASVHLGWDTEDWTCVDFDARASTVHVRSIASPPGFAAAVATLGAPRGVQVLTLD